jgi:ribosomal protein S18 acetylase RimI-like enzyme
LVALECGGLGVDVVALTPADWPMLKAIRLRALRDSPHAFGSDHEKETAWSGEQWRSTFVSASWFMAFGGRDAVGLARTVRAANTPHQCHVESVWVAPSERRRGVCRAMFAELIVRERRRGVTLLLAWVLDGNHDARRVYERLGFQVSGLRQPFPGAPGRIEEQLQYRISGTPGWA